MNDNHPRNYEVKRHGCAEDVLSTVCFFWFSTIFFFEKNSPVAHRVPHMPDLTLADPGAFGQLEGLEGQVSFNQFLPGQRETVPIGWDMMGPWNTLETNNDLCSFCSVIFHVFNRLNAFLGRLGRWRTANKSAAKSMDAKPLCCSSVHYFFVSIWTRCLHPCFCFVAAPAPNLDAESIAPIHSSSPGGLSSVPVCDASATRKPSVSV